jgi:hypothetical protein
MKWTGCVSILSLIFGICNSVHAHHAGVVEVDAQLDSRQAELTIFLSPLELLETWQKSRDPARHQVVPKTDVFRQWCFDYVQTSVVMTTDDESVAVPAKVSIDRDAVGFAAGKEGFPYGLLPVRLCWISASPVKRYNVTLNIFDESSTRDFVIRARFGHSPDIREFTVGNGQKISFPVSGGVTLIADPVVRSAGTLKTIAVPRLVVYYLAAGFNNCLSLLPWHLLLFTGIVLISLRRPQMPANIGLFLSSGYLGIYLILSEIVEIPHFTQTVLGIGAGSLLIMVLLQVDKPILVKGLLLSLGVTYGIDCGAGLLKIGFPGRQEVLSAFGFVLGSEICRLVPLLFVSGFWFMGASYFGLNHNLPFLYTLKPPWKDRHLPVHRP